MKSINLKDRDKLFDECARLVVQMQSGSTSNLQRRLNLGYNRAGRIMDQLEAAGVVGPASGAIPREVYFKTEHDLEIFLSNINEADYSVDNENSERQKIKNKLLEKERLKILEEEVRQELIKAGKIKK